MSTIRDAQSLGDLLRRNCQLWPDRTALWVPIKGDFDKVTYGELWERVLGMAGAFRNLGLQQGDRVAIFAESGISWAISDWGAQVLGLIVVPIYPTLPGDQAAYIVQDSGAKMILVGNSELAGRVEGLVDSQIVGLGPVGNLPNVEQLASAHALSQSEAESALRSVRRDDLATIIYTSGTTGNPKGAMLKHDSFLILMEGVQKNLPVGPDDTFLSFLPMSHVYERSAGHFLPMAIGASVAYAGSLATLAGDMVKVKPTVMLCVPRFLESVRARIVDAVEKDKPFRQFLFRAALSQGLKRSQGKFAPMAGLLDKLVGAKIRARTGGRIRFFVSGGSALPQHIAEFYMAFRLLVLQGYGLTETCAITSVNHPDRSDYTTVGEVIEGVEVKIAPDGEILIRGRGVMAGYYGKDEATREAIDPEGWFHSGDIGQFVGQRLKITDRKKDLLVLANGKNVAPQPIEGKIREASHIAEAVLFGDNMEYVCALLIPDFDALKRHYKNAGRDYPGDSAAAIDPDVRKLLKSELDEVNRSLADFEKVKKFEILDHTFSIESGELTPSMKVKRKVVKERYADRIDSMKR
ncbi:MAG TPA: long-chain fatty acid--CoA ligase [Fimbriimonadaceae bacterium]|nr:long-chain fatty acid--CoA ligase [Fimbriimonadaceae bacterium]HRJ33132.1 long-chain fatty acid--CoA ligase [Fimbriimonadaceae bacterium]